ncbi:MAG: hypothetical protein J4G03_09095 [Gemmatimonadetes bacterium]|nr:hypothetical protein [Gemmatimonadota bacterium]
MSMICGIQDPSVAAAAQLDGMLDALPGRETDARAAWAGTSAVLGWRGRPDVGAGEAQGVPHFDAESGLAITASVRLDGRNTLCEALGVPGAQRQTIADSVLVLKAYQHWGLECPRHLLGDFAFALWDEKRQRLFCARDHVGARAFCYAFAGERFVFASDIDTVLAAPGVCEEFDETVVATRLTYGARPLGDRTCYRSIRRLLPGHALVVERGARRFKRWWRPEELPEVRNASDDAIAEECLAILSEAVRDRLRGRRPVGVHLSGGLDSSSIAVLAARELARQGSAPPVAFGWHPPPGRGPRDAAADAEYGPIEAVCRQEGINIVYQSPQARDVVDFLRRDGTRRADEGSLIHEQIVQRAAAARGVGLLLSGWGGDEGISFNGRGYYPLLLRTGRLGKLWRELRECSSRPLAMLLEHAALPLLAPGAARAARRLRLGESALRKNITFIHPEFARRATLLPAKSRPSPGGRGEQLHVLQLGHLSRRMEGWAASGASLGLEYAYPLLDRRVLEFALGLPPDQYRRGRWSRWLIRHALGSVLPPEVRWNREKRDPARYEPALDALAEALPVVRGMIAERPPPRGRYLDLPRLLEQMEPKRWRDGGRYGPVLNALRFLDF